MVVIFTGCGNNFKSHRSRTRPCCSELQIVMNSHVSTLHGRTGHIPLKVLNQTSRFFFFFFDRVVRDLKWFYFYFLPFTPIMKFHSDFWGGRGKVMLRIIRAVVQMAPGGVGLTGAAGRAPTAQRASRWCSEGQLVRDVLRGLQLVQLNQAVACSGKWAGYQLHCLEIALRRDDGCCFCCSAFPITSLALSASCWAICLASTTSVNSFPKVRGVKGYVIQDEPKGCCSLHEVIAHLPGLSGDQFSSIQTSHHGFEDLCSDARQHVLIKVFPDAGEDSGKWLVTGWKGMLTFCKSLLPVITGTLCGGGR